MNLQIDASVAKDYKSPSQIVRVATEAWGRDNLYCVACASPKLKPLSVNTPARDFFCNHCCSVYLLKARRDNSRRVTDAGYEAMIEAIRSENVPALLVMQYSPQWTVRNLLVVPPFFFSESCIVKRKPLKRGTRREGWVGCDILLSKIPQAGRLHIVSDGLVRPVSQVRREYRDTIAIKKVETENRGWTLDVLRVVQDLPSCEFTLEVMYAFDKDLAALHPKNKHVRPKMRQQLQVLRDMGYVEFVSPGRYRRLK